MTACSASIAPSGWIVSLSKIALRANHDTSAGSTSRTKLDRVLVKDRIESKPRLGDDLALPYLCWIVSLSKIALRANHDLQGQVIPQERLDRVLVKDRIESKPRQRFSPAQGHGRWIVSLSKIALRANHDTAGAWCNASAVGSCPCQRSH